MKKLIFVQLLLTSFFVIGQNVTKIKGFVKNIDKDTLILAQAHKDFRYSGTEIPVKEGKMFQYTLKHKYIEEYAFVYKSDLKKGHWRPIQFFPNGKTIDFELYPLNEYDKNKIIGDKLREKKIKYLHVFSEKFAKLGNDIYGKLFQLKKDSEQYNKTKSRLDSLNKAVLAFQYNYFLNDNNILGLNTYVYLLKSAKNMLISPDFFKNYQSLYLRKENNHPLFKRAINLYTDLFNEIKVGQKYVDITLTDKKNNSLKLSELIKRKKKKYTILDLWSPWCSPCIRKSNLLKQNYQKINTNVQIIGVVGGISEVEKAVNAISRFAYPWKNFAEISNKNRIWEKYGIANSGGAQFLINKDGKILAINPNIEKLLKIIKDK